MIPAIIYYDMTLTECICIFTCMQENACVMWSWSFPFLVTILFSCKILYKKPSTLLHVWRRARVNPVLVHHFHRTRWWYPGNPEEDHDNIMQVRFFFVVITTAKTAQPSRRRNKKKSFSQKRQTATRMIIHNARMMVMMMTTVAARAMVAKG